jgi:hypothetical protein
LGPSMNAPNPRLRAARPRKLGVVPDGRLYRVIVPKSGGRTVEFSRYEFESDARRATIFLRWAGAAAIVIGPNGEIDISEAAL